MLTKCLRMLFYYSSLALILPAGLAIMVYLPRDIFDLPTQILMALGLWIIPQVFTLVKTENYTNEVFWWPLWNSAVMMFFMHVMARTDNKDYSYLNPYHAIIAISLIVWVTVIIDKWFPYRNKLSKSAK